MCGPSATVQTCYNIQNVLMDVFYCLLIYSIVCVCVRVHVCVYVLLCMHGGHKLLPSFYHAGPRDQTQVISLDDEHAHLLSHLSGPGDVFNLLQAARSFLSLYLPKCTEARKSFVLSHLQWEGTSKIHPNLEVYDPGFLPHPPWVNLTI